jgi:hypothetical protein
MFEEFSDSQRTLPNVDYCYFVISNNKTCDA